MESLPIHATPRASKHHDHGERLTLSTVLSLLIHGLLALALVLGLSWNNREPEVLQAELWAPIAAPPPPPAPAVADEPKPTPTPTPKPQITPPKPAETPPPKPTPNKPDIALKQPEPKKPKPKEEPKPTREPEKVVEKPKEKDKPKEPVKEAPKPKEPPKPEPKTKPETKPEPKPEAKPAKKPETTAKSSDSRADDDRATEARRQAEMARIMGGSTGGGAPQVGANRGLDAQGQAEYSAAIRGKIRQNIRFDTQGLAGNPEVIFLVEQLPTGEIVKISKIKSSGQSAWDDAVERAINLANPLPRKRDGTVERQLELKFRPLDAR